MQEEIYNKSVEDLGAPSLMFQGTGSSVGKTFLLAGLGRLLKNKGFNVAPFKSQNMSLNSAVCVEGTEISRAQAMQAEACGKAPQAAMNPILLKPQSDKKAQLILDGEVVGTFTAKEYHKMKLELLPKCLKQLERLRSRHDVVLIEGAGSPAEINLLKEDIANMKIAKAAQCPVIIIGDIDKGGVFASLYGTYKLLPAEEQKRIAGFIINKFRGDKTLLDDGITFLEQKTRVPVLGVLPFVNLELDAEDSANDFQSSTGEVDVAVIKLPKISNFTDFWPLQKEHDAGLRYVSNPKELENADVIIIPGSKSVISDLAWLKLTGLDKAIIKAAANNKFIFGMCGGFQMLGNLIEDRNGVESAPCKAEGLNLLDLKTSYQGSKITRNVTVKFSANSSFSCFKDLEVQGYEIHNGVSRSSRKCCFQANEDDHVLGLGKDNIFGTYIHGIFDNDKFRRTYLNLIRTSKGLNAIEKTYDLKHFKESQYDQLAKMLEANLNMKAIFKLLFPSKLSSPKKELQEVGL